MAVHPQPGEKDRGWLIRSSFVGRAGTDVVERCVIAVGVCWTVGRPEGGRGCVWAGLSPRLTDLGRPHAVWRGWILDLG